MNILFNRKVEEFAGNFSELFEAVNEILQTKGKPFFQNLSPIHYAIANRLPIDPVIEFVVKEIGIDINDRAVLERTWGLNIAIESGASLQYIKDLLSLGAKPQKSFWDIDDDHAEIVKCSVLKPALQHSEKDELIQLLFKEGADLYYVREGQDRDALTDLFKKFELIDQAVLMTALYGHKESMAKFTKILNYPLRHAVSYLP